MKHFHQSITVEQGQGDLLFPALNGFIYSELYVIHYLRNVRTVSLVYDVKKKQARINPNIAAHN